MNNNTKAKKMFSDDCTNECLKPDTSNLPAAPKIEKESTKPPEKLAYLVVSECKEYTKEGSDEALTYKVVIYATAMAKYNNAYEGLNAFIAYIPKRLVVGEIEWNAAKTAATMKLPLWVINAKAIEARKQQGK